MSASRNLRRATVAMALLAGVAAAPAATWSTVGSAGTVDDTDLGIADLIFGEARVRASAPAGSTLNLTYNVVSLQGFTGPGQYQLRVRFRDNGPAARVTLGLHRFNSTTGARTNLAVFDSNAYPPMGTHQVKQRCITIPWNFEAGPHFIEATLFKSGVLGIPALATIQLIPAYCGV